MWAGADGSRRATTQVGCKTTQAGRATTGPGRAQTGPGRAQTGPKSEKTSASHISLKTYPNWAKVMKTSASHTGHVSSWSRADSMTSSNYSGLETLIQIGYLGVYRLKGNYNNVFGSHSDLLSVFLASTFPIDAKKHLKRPIWTSFE